MKTRATLALATCLLLPAAAGAQVVSGSTGTIRHTDNVVHEATGSSMSNMQVRVCMTSDCYTRSWGDLGNGFHGVRGDNMFQIAVGSGTDTFGANAWRFDLFSDDALLSVEFFGLSGNTVFDRSRPNPGSPGSSDGFDSDIENSCMFTWLGFLGPAACANFDDVTVGYVNEVHVGGTFYGDLYEGVRIDFANADLSAGGGLDNTYTNGCTELGFLLPCGDRGFYMRMDTDNAPFSTVPEPSTYVLMTAGLAALGVLARRRRRA